MMRNVPVLLVATQRLFTDQFTAAMSRLTVDVIESQPTYTCYIKVLQYLPAVVIMELPKMFHDQLHFLQMLKQNSAASEIPVICFGDSLSDKVRTGLLKIGMTEYFESPVEMRNVLSAMVRLLRNRGFTLSPKAESGTPADTGSADPISALDTPREVKIELMLRHVNDMTAFPFTLTAAMKLAQDAECGIADLSHAIESDPVISLQFLKRANSTFFAGTGKRISSLRDAIVRIGLDETRRILCGIAVIGMFDAQTKNQGFDRVLFWRHCLAVAVIAEKLAGAGGKVDRGEAFLAGLLHDFGIIVLDEFFPDLFRKVLGYATDKGIRFYQAEEKLLMIDHSEVVSRLFMLWKIPESITNAVVYHYQVMERNRMNPDGVEAEPLSIVTGLANVIAKSWGLGMSCDQYVTFPDAKLFAAAGITGELPGDFYRSVMKVLDDYGRLISPEDKNTVQEPAGGGVMRPKIGCVERGSIPFNPVVEHLKMSGFEIRKYTDGKSAAFPDFVPELFVVFPGSHDADVYAAVRKRIAALQEANGKSPVLVFCPKGESCGFAQDTVSVVPVDLDLRMLQLYMGSVLDGRKVTAEKTAGTVGHQTVTSFVPDGDESLAGTRRMQMYREKCLVNGIDGKEVRLALECLQKVKADAGNDDLSRKERARQTELAAEYFRKAWLINELSGCERRIGDLQSG